MSEPAPQHYGQPILIIDDEPDVLRFVAAFLNRGGYTNCISCGDSRDALERVSKEPPSLIITDLAMPHVSGRELLAQFTAQHPHIPVIVLTGRGDSDTAVWCIKNGAFDFVVKPITSARLLSAVRLALEFRELQVENMSLQATVLGEESTVPEAFSDIVTVSRTMHSIFRYLESIAKTNQSVLITGETGTGKELIAEAIHTASARTGELIAVNVAGLEETSFSDALFGHERGAFTGATRARDGLIKRAAGGTLFLDEIGDLTPELQVRLLRLLQNREYYRLGSDTPRFMEARIVVATNRELAELHRTERFRADLYYRLRTHHVHLPSLRERREDIPALLAHFLDAAATALGRQRPDVPSELGTLLANYPFPGNIRELESMVFDAVSQHRSGQLSLQAFADAMGSAAREPSGKAEGSPGRQAPMVGPGREVVFGATLPTPSRLTDLLIDEALNRTEGNQAMAARLLGMSRQALNRRIHRGK